MAKQHIILFFISFGRFWTQGIGNLLPKFLPRGPATIAYELLQPLRLLCIFGPMSQARAANSVTKAVLHLVRLRPPVLPLLLR
jgi:hypothetical protein